MSQESQCVFQNLLLFCFAYKKALKAGSHERRKRKHKQIDV